MIDMDITSAPPTRSASPTGTSTRLGRLVVGTPSVPSGETLDSAGDGDLVARKAGMGRLMKSAKQDIQVPEFDMNAFF